LFVNEIVLSVCSTTDANKICLEYLPDYCSKTQTSYDFFALNPTDNFSQLCSCYLPSSTYPYEGLINQNCTSACASSPFNAKEKCSTSDCIIDFNLANVIVTPSANISIKNICESQNNKLPNCYFTSDAVTKIIGATGTKIDTNQNCGKCELINKDNTTGGIITCPVTGQDKYIQKVVDYFSKKLKYKWIPFIF